MAFPLFLPLLFLFLLVGFIFLSKNQRSKNQPPGPPRLPIIGNFYQMRRLNHRVLWQLSKKYGPVMLIKLGFVPILVISSSETAKDFFKNHDLYTCSRPRLTGYGKLSYNFLDVVFTAYGDYWREMKKFFVLELLNPKRVESFRLIREDEVSLLIESISKSSSSSSTVDIGDEITRFQANLICREAFGKSFRERGFAQEKLQESLHEVQAIFGCHAAADFFPYVGWIFDRITGLHSRLERCFQHFDAFYQEIIDDHIQKNDERDQDVVDLLLQMEASQTQDFYFSRNHFKAILMDIFVGGSDTGAITMVWAMTELIRHPRVMKKAQEEIRSSIGRDKARVYEEDINTLDYLKMVVKETMRLHPPGTLLGPREATSQFSINGYNINPKTRIQINAWAIARDPNIWENPDEFYPERFVEKSFDFIGNSYEMFPFGGGRRMCPGVGLALAGLELALANLLFCFDWKLPENTKVEDLNEEAGTASVTVRKKQPLLLVPTRYQHA